MNRPFRAPSNATPACQEDRGFNDEQSSNRASKLNRSKSLDVSPSPALSFPEKRAMSFRSEGNVNHAKEERPNAFTSIVPPEQPLRQSNSVEQCTPQEKGETMSTRTTFLNAIINLKLMLAESESEADSAKSLCIRISLCNAELRDMSNTAALRNEELMEEIKQIKLVLAESQSEADSAKSLCSRLSLCNAELREMRNATSLRNEELREESKQINDELTRRNAQLKEENASLKREVDQMLLERKSFKSRLKLVSTEEFSPEETIAPRKLVTQSFLGLAKNLLWDDRTNEDAPKVQSIDVKKQVASRAA